jgi:3-methyladenine DNA glycosylase AlkD
MTTSKKHVACLKEVEVALRSAAKGVTKEKAEERRQHMKAVMPLLGLTVPQQRTCFKKGYGFSSFDAAEQFPIWDHIWRHAKYHEAKMQAVFFLGSLKRKHDPSDLWSVIRGWADDINCWDQSDELSKAYSYLLAHDQNLVYPQLKAWNDDRDPWKRRQSVVGLMCYANLHTKHPAYNKIIPLVGNLLDDEDYYVQKGVGWTLREAYRVYPDKTFSFILKNAGVIDPAAFSAALEKMTVDEKNRIKAARKIRRRRT